MPAALELEPDVSTLAAFSVIEHRNGKVRGHGRSLARLDGTQLHALRIRIK